MFVKLFKRMLVFGTAVVIFLLVPIIFVGSLPIFIFRRLITYIQPLNIGKILTTRSSLLAPDDLRKPLGNLLICLTVEGTLDVSHLKDLIQKNILEYSESDGDEKVRYPEMSQKLTRRWGFYFWEDDPEFSLDDHVTVIPEKGRPITEEDLEEIKQALIIKEWDPNHPLWEIVLVHHNLKFDDSFTCTNDNNTDKTWTAVNFRLNHVLGDGFSILHLITTKLCDCSSIPVPRPRENSISLFKQALFWITFPCKAAYQMAFCFWFPILHSRRVPFKFSKKGGESRWPFLIHSSRKIPLQVIRDIKNYFNVSFSATILAIVTGALRETMNNRYTKLPKSIPINIALPLSGHSFKLRNHMTAWYVNLPISIIDAEERIKKCQLNYQKVVNSTGPLMMNCFLPILGSYCSPILELISRNPSFCMGLSNFPGVLSPISFGGHRIVDAMFSSGPHRGVHGIALCGVSYDKCYRFSPTAVSMSKDELKEFSFLLTHHAQLLHNYTKTGNYYNV